MVYGIEAGDLQKWLGVVRANSAEGATAREIPARFVDHLVALKCAQVESDGALRITEKGLLALRMARPDALHLGDEDDEA